MEGPNLCQIEILVLDLQRSIDFYCKVLDLEIVPIDIHGQAIFKVPQHSPWGFSLRQSSEPIKNRSVLLYFAVRSLEESARMIESIEFGAMVEEQYIAGYGRVLYISDPDGSVFALFEGA